MPDEQLARYRVERCGERSVDQIAGLVITECLQDQGLAVGQARSAWSGRPKNQHRPGCLREHPGEQLDQRLGGPVQVVERENGRAARADLRDEPHPFVLEREHGCARLEIAGDVEAESQPEGFSAAKFLERRVLLAQIQLLPEDVGERAVGDAAAVGEAATEPEGRGGR
ncbi:MAG TPA: hypothetical protein VFW80_10440 [Gaiellaceae bacterium]|nr:hypothetical protein [Gaiellaceae bacterium]